MKDKFSWEKFRSEKFAILCENKIVQEMFIKRALKQGFKIYTSEDTFWDKYKENAFKYKKKRFKKLFCYPNYMKSRELFLCLAQNSSKQLTY